MAFLPAGLAQSGSSAPSNGSSQGAALQSVPANEAGAPQSASGDTAGSDQGRFVFRKQVEEVVLHATVVDAQGHLVPNLDRNAFTIFQNGILQKITSFRQEDVPVEIGIVVDNSGSMRDKRRKVDEAVLNLIRASNPQDESFVVNFGQTPYLDQDFTSNVQLLQTALHQVSAEGSTALYDAVVASAVHLEDNSLIQKKVLLVVTDGQDNMSRETLADAMRRLQTKNGPVVYAIGLTDGEMNSSGREALQQLASSTGGAAYFPESLDDVDSITRAVAHDIRSQYTLAYNPGSTAGKTGYQRIHVEARAPGYSVLTVRTRSGYYPGETVR
ncbi:MAG TPA: VWA domain-containing protein [Verrucomicrobiae bacterium]|nr:VWA domain-containing protein [Verrucomicrobiae bacterium]